MRLFWLGGNQWFLLNDFDFTGLLVDCGFDNLGSFRSVNCNLIDFNNWSGFDLLDFGDGLGGGDGVDFFNDWLDN